MRRIGISRRRRVKMIDIVFGDIMNPGMFFVNSDFCFSGGLCFFSQISSLAEIICMSRRKCMHFSIMLQIINILHDIMFKCFQCQVTSDNALHKPMVHTRGPTLLSRSFQRSCETHDCTLLKLYENDIFNNLLPLQHLLHTSKCFYLVDYLERCRSSLLYLLFRPQL